VSFNSNNNRFRLTPYRRCYDICGCQTRRWNRFVAIWSSGRMRKPNL